MPNPVLWGVLAGVTNFIPHVGALLAVPILAMVKILCDRIEGLARIGEFLGQ